MGSGSSKTRRIGGDCGSAASYCASPSSSISSVSSVVGGRNSSSSSSNSSSNRKRRKEKNRKGVFRSSCLGSSSGAYDTEEDDDDQVSDHRDEVRRMHVLPTGSESDELKLDCYQNVKIDGSDDMPCVSSNVEFDERTHATRGDHVTRAAGSSSHPFSARSLNRSSRFLSRFSFVPGNISFRFNGSASVGSSRAYPSSPTSFATSTCEENLHLHRGLHGLINGSENQPSGNPYSSSGSIRSHNDNGNERTRPDVAFPSFGDHLDIESFNRRHGERRNCPREPVDGNVRFSRTLSVGRLRDRVLRPSSFSDSTLPPLQLEQTATSDENSVNSLISSPYPLRSIHNSFYASQNNDVETSLPRETRRSDLLEHRSNFLERRRRIRSQVRALQRLGSRFENLSGHERYCILSGQHRTGRCSCPINTRGSNSNDDVGARASISRIVMLAEALFEVLDEIHQQSVVLSSRPSVSSIGSVPAPNEVVESLPSKVFNKSAKLQCEEVAQCYICLVEYDEGDEMRILPCQHEFHKKCIDKWLKEIHRVCPLCRGDICKPDSSSLET